MVLVRVRKVITAKIMDAANKRKLDALKKEYTNFQKALSGENVDIKLYSATR